MPYVTEGTYKPEWARSKEKNMAKLHAMLLKAKRVSTYDPGFGIVVPIFKASENPSTDFYFAYDKDEDGDELIQYGCRLVHYKFTGVLNETLACGQVSVKRNKMWTKSGGLAKFLFNEIFFPIYGRILSDSTQSKEGKNFWNLRVLESLQSGHKVYALEIEGSHVLKQTPILSPTELTPFYTEGQDYAGFYHRLLIERKGL